MNRFTRRAFIKGTAGVAAILPFTAKSYADIVGTNEGIRAAVVGFNGRGQSHLSDLGKQKEVRIAGLCATGTGDPRSPATDGDPRTIVAVVPRRGHPNQHLTVEYRPAVGDDAGVTPAVVVHSIGANFVGVGRDEVDPPWFEASLPPVVGAFADVLGYRFTVVAVSAAAPEWVEVRIQLSSSSEA